tara:strand:+ start:12 stop:551 length:540 start_codon:yes stop_codon:yes gene_type:complete
MVKKKKKQKKIKKVKFKNKKIQKYTYTSDKTGFLIRWVGPYANSPYLAHPIIATSLFSIFSYFWLSLVFLDDYNKPGGGFIAVLALFSLFYLGLINLVLWSNCLFKRCKKCQKVFTSEIISKDYLGSSTSIMNFKVKVDANTHRTEEGELTTERFNNFMRCLSCGYKWQQVSTDSYRSK